jgi:AraC-like DNA-binding protein
MTTITFYKSNGIYYGFEEQGHTGYGESGDDVLCAALSSMTMLIINAIEVSYATRVDYQIDEKMRAAKTILRRSNLTVAEIAERLGYCDQHYFSNQFKKKCGISPSEYRKK